MSSKTDASFPERVLQAFKKINGEINLDTVEHDFSPRLGRHFCEDVLGFESKQIRYERNRTDMTLLDENNARAVVIETKRPNVNLDAEKWRDQAGTYADAATRFVGLTNGFRFLLWEVKKQERDLKVDIDFKALIDAKRASEEHLTTQEIEQLLFLGQIHQQQVWSEQKYARFDEYYATIDVSETGGFEKLIEQLNYISNDLLRQYTFSAFDEYYAGYAQYRATKEELEQIKRAGGKNMKAVDIARFELKTEGKYKKYADFSGYFIWKALSNRSDDQEEQNKQAFCKESIYLLINRLLFIRICEDKGLLGKKISNGGIERLREQLAEPILGETGLFKQIVQFSYGGAKNIYSHFYEKDNPLDWYESGDGDLDRALNRVLWILNQFKFEKVDRDILGKLYEKYLPKDERKKLGEFYTPDEVIDYILDALEYSPSKAIEGKDLIDPACGSGGFLVRAARRLIARHAVKFEKATPKEALDNRRWPEVYARLSAKECEEIVNAVATHIHGFDINPFAVSITEMNLLFQVIDLYSKAVKENRGFKVPRFQVYETDSLEPPTEQTSLTQFYGATGKSLAKDKDQSDELKKKKYDFVVGNPPYLSIKDISADAKKVCEKTFTTAKGQYDLYTLFIEFGTSILQPSGRFGFIIPDAFLGRSNAQPIRELILNKGLINALQIYGVFEDPSVANAIIITKPNSSEVLLAKIPFEKINGQIEWVTLPHAAVQNLPNKKLIFLRKSGYKLLEKIRTNGTPLEAILSDMWRGEELGKKTGAVKTAEKDAFKQIIFGEDIKRYGLDASKRFINPMDIKKGNKYFQKKIVIRQLGAEINAALDEKGEYVTIQSTYNLVPKMNAEFILGLLNSELINWYYVKLFREKELFPRVLLENIKALPIIELKQEHQKKTAEKISLKVKEILKIKKKNVIADTKALEEEIDGLVFELYGITHDERKIIGAAVAR